MEAKKTYWSDEGLTFEMPEGQAEPQEVDIDKPTTSSPENNLDDDQILSDSQQDLSMPPPPPGSQDGQPMKPDPDPEIQDFFGPPPMPSGYYI